jgi:hypothetical protein
MVSVEGGPWTAAVFHGLFLILESLSSAEFWRRPKRLSGFRFVANSFAIDQWAFLRQLGVPTAQEAKEVQDLEEGVEDFHLHHEEGGFRPNGA